MKLMFRPHRGGIKESLADTQELKSLQDLNQIVKNIFIVDEVHYILPDISLKYYGEDIRCEQKLWLVIYREKVCGYIYEELEK